MKFSDPNQESAVLGYVTLNGFDKSPEKDICPPHDFTDARWRPIYSAAVALHRAGRVVNQYSITEEIERLGFAADLQSEIPTGWENWPAHTDGSLTFVVGSVTGCLRDIHRLALQRECVKVGEQIAEGEIDAGEGRDRLAAILEGSRVNSHAALLSARRFDSKNPPAKARAIYEINRHVICTPGNLTAVCAKAKAGKSALVGGFIAAAFGRDGDTLGVDSVNSDDRAVVHFDTEQSPADHHLLVATALFRVGTMEGPSWLRSYRVADVPMRERFDLLEHELRQANREHGGIHSVILDGIADFIADPNDPAEAFTAVDRLHRLAVTHDTAIISVLHVNPGSESNKTRGHLGSQLERKAETNLMLEKDDEGVSALFTRTSRHADISRQDGPRFRWDEKAMMHVSIESGRAVAAKETSSRLRMIAADVFGSGGLKYTAAISAVSKAAKVGDKRAETLFSDMKKAGIISQDLTGFWEQKR